MLGSLQDKLRALLNQSAGVTSSAETNNAELSLPLATASLLFEVAWADHNVSELEQRALKHALIALFSLTEAQVEQVLETGRKQHQASVGVYPYTRLINENLNKAEKFELLIQLWSIALVDDGLDQFEEHRIRAIAELLYVDHPDFIRAKQQARTRQANS